MNFSLANAPEERKKVFKLFQNAPYCYASPLKPLRDYLIDLAKSRFVLSPRGNGIDCHRTWEALLMGAIPIVKASPMDAAFDGLPVLIIHDWKEINEEFLNAKWVEMQNREYQLERMYAPYWLNLISSFREA